MVMKCYAHGNDAMSNAKNAYRVFRYALTGMQIL